MMISEGRRVQVALLPKILSICPESLTACEPLPNLVPVGTQVQRCHEVAC